MNFLLYIPHILGELKGNILDILLPKFCLGCGKEGCYICKDCETFLSELPFITETQKKEVNPFSVWEYEGIVEKAILRIKFDSCHEIINELVEKAFERIELNLPPDTCITYVPMWSKKERQRGFNQAKLIAHRLSLLFSRNKQYPFRVGPLLKKLRDNRTQVGLGPKEREENVKGVFGFRGSFVPRNVLLVDDVYTTGATAKECVRVLKKAGVENVWVFTLARKLRI